MQIIDYKQFAFVVISLLLQVKYSTKLYGNI